MEKLKEEILSNQEINEIQQGLENVRMGKTTPIEQVAKDLGIVLR